MDKNIRIYVITLTGVTALVCLALYGVVYSSAYLARFEETVTQEDVDIRLKAYDWEDGWFRIEVNNINTPPESIGVAVWNEEKDSSGNMQDDLVWHTVYQDNSRNYADIQLADHGNVTGKYNIHVYIQDIFWGDLRITVPD